MMLLCVGVVGCSFSASKVSQGNNLQYIIEDEVCFMCASEMEFSRRICFAFLSK